VLGRADLKVKVPYCPLVTSFPGGGAEDLASTHRLA
jgi:hypothetical protein